MSLSALVNGADCGPVNPLQGLTKQLDRDRGAQSDQFRSGRAGPSRETFRTQSASPHPGLAQDAERFFSGTMQPGVSRSPAPFDMSALNGALGGVTAPPSTKPLAGWANDFVGHHGRELGVQPRNIPQEEFNRIFEGERMKNLSPGPGWQIEAERFQEHPELLNRPQFIPPMGMMQSGMPPTFDPGFQAMRPQIPLTQQHPSQDAAWHRQFASIEELSTTQETAARSKDPMVADDLAATAGMLLESVKDEQNPKFQNSSFMRLMHLLHDREVVVDGNDMVERSSGAPASTSASPWVEEFERQVQMDKGKGRAVEPGSTSLNQISLPMSPAPMYNGPLYNPGIPLSQGLFAGGLAQQQMPHITDTLSSARLSSALDNEFARLASEQPTTTRRKSVHFESASDSQQEASSSSEAAPQVNWDEDFTMDDFQKNMNMEQLSKEMGMGGIQNMSGLEQIAEWERLQRDWDNFEASATGIRPVSSYEFQANNPYLGRAEEAGMTRNHLMHQGAVQSLSQSVLEQEAAVQKNANDANAWFELGVKQQENEREEKAIQALTRALSLEPSHLPAWLALSISYTNENDREAAYDSLQRWVDENKKYEGVIARYKLESAGTVALGERHQVLIDSLLAMVRNSPDGEVDADVQIALAVLLNINEDYEKARDCFTAALAVRPNDWLLYNRVGATLANSGSPAEALEYYYRALELNPSYIRARFNLAISCINLKMYTEAAQHILDALVLQENEAASQPPNFDPSGGLSSSALWDCLKATAVHMQRQDLVKLAELHDLEGFRGEFQGDQ